MAGLAAVQGEVAALAGALLWAISAVIYARMGQRVPALVLNFSKGAIAITLILLTLVLGRSPLPAVAPAVVWLLAASGIIGIGLGDTAYLNALRTLGARRALLLETLAPPLSAILAWGTLGEALTLGSWLGIALTLLGVAWVISERTPSPETAIAPLKIGLLWGLLAELAQATGAVMSRAALVDSAMPPLWSSVIRLGGGEVILLLLLLGRRAQLRETLPNLTRRTGTAIAIAAFGGTYLAIWFQQIALKYTATGTAQTLLATSPLFVLPLAVLWGEKITQRSALGVGIAIAGIAILFQS
jgi:drug/metabolite transporter (DMT)-like permease